MKTSFSSRRTNFRRKTHYIDESLQKLLLAGLVLLETGLALVLTWLMWRHLHHIIDDNLYRVHLTHTMPILPQLIQEALFLLGIFFITNLAALLLVDLIWRHHIHTILLAFRNLMSKTAALDFSTDPEHLRHHHILDYARAQRAKDRQRLTEFRERLRNYKQNQSTSNSITTTTDLLQDLYKLLPQNQTSPEEPPRSTTR